MTDMSNEDQRRLASFIEARTELFGRIHSDIHILERTALKLAQADLVAECPDNFKEFDDVMGRLDGVLDHYLRIMKDELRRRQDAPVDNSEFQKHIYNVEDQQVALTNLRLDMRRWFMWFEGEPSEAERLEMMMSLPTEEEVEAEKREAYRTHGANLLPKNEQDKVSST